MKTINARKDEAAAKAAFLGISLTQYEYKVKGDWYDDERRRHIGHCLIIDGQLKPIDDDDSRLLFRLLSQELPEQRLQEGDPEITLNRPGIFKVENPSPNYSPRAHPGYYDRVEADGRYVGIRRRGVVHLRGTDEAVARAVYAAGHKRILSAEDARMWTIYGWSKKGDYRFPFF